MWDAKRQLVWLAAGLILGTFVAYSDAHDEDGTFVPRFFVFMETLVLGIIAFLFYLYSRKNR
jgi:flagellar biosynthesis protein FliQ